MHRATLAILAAAPALLVAGAAFAQAPAGDPMAGLGIARIWCSNCHVVDTAPVQAGDAVPSFPAIANLPSTTRAGLRAFVVTPHGRMPNFQLTTGQADDVVAYILSLKGR
ncbi:c-type cytochrome [Limobrevibacterium gyesilva]|uniref:Cytochrome c n=1 Tax=Limobrevibacterium gyesilva TaxID=2991712 RepID=A0AA41YMB3_9PROT|nr:cytochrome c [Limobrevibacterium gyesilva]MCW3473108.1 cytochrome c [Limobrevibacterium gyesilva]